MNCLYCRALNADDEHRCQRCGRRLHYASTAVASAPQYSHTALAEERAPRVRIHSRLAAKSAPELVPGAGNGRRTSPTFQPNLFGTKDMGTVLPFNAFVANPKPPAAPRTARPRVRRTVSTNQQSLNFVAPVVPSAVPRTREGVIYCDARVATLPHRSLAAFVDFTVVALALGAFIGTLYSFGGEVLLNRDSAPLYVAIAAITVLLYRALWCLGNGDSLGMRVMQLRMVDLDGRRPNRRQRLIRMFSGWLSVLAAGLGLFWALADEESLTWHDHISRTFPTSRE